jgi:hypothetical protein
MAEGEKPKPRWTERRREKRSEKNKTSAVRVAQQQRDAEAAVRRRDADGYSGPPTSGGGMA